MSGPALRQRPIYGGVFGTGKYALATTPAIANGLHAVKFMVIEPRSGSVLSVAENKLEALASARRVLRVANSLYDEAANDPRWEQATLWPAESTPPSAGAPLRRVSTRRRAIFDKSMGRCHYCSTPLTLDGKWHVEHMVPRALDGGDQLMNLVASCVRCNLSKGTQTALQFLSWKGTNERDQEGVT